MTSLPSNGDYVQALQHPNACFCDQELKTGTVQSTSLGMPKAISGNFASVFSITSSSGKRYAVKCFTRDVPGQNERYEAIHSALASLARPWQVGFEFIAQGVMVEGRWYPILRMEWVEDSRTLIPWLESNLGHPDRILDVAGQFARCIEDLQGEGIAHGDLQHGNLLIDSNSKLRVIDYDGMFVPSIQHLGSNELGLANYQHPGRTSSDFGPYLDRFSAWLIYGSLLSLAAHPGLWWTFRQAGDEKLLLGKEDFVPPLDTIERLGLLGSPHAEVAGLLADMLKASSSPSSVPEFDPGRISLPTPVEHQQQTSPVLEWWRQSRASSVGINTGDASAASVTRLGASWLRSHEAPLPPVSVVGPSKATKALSLALTAVAMLGALAVGAMFNLFVAGLVLLTWATVVTAGAWILWRRSDAVVGQADARQRVRLANRELTSQRKRVEKARRDRDVLDKDERRAIQELENQRGKLSKQSKAEFERESKALTRRATTLQTALNRLDNTKAAEVQQQLKLLREQHIHAYMAARRIEPGMIHGIGETMVIRLSVYGIRSAADIAAVNGNQFMISGSNKWITIHGIGPSKASSISYWHQRQRMTAESGAPQALPPQQLKALDAKFADQKKQHQVALDALGPQLRQIQATVDAKYAALDREITVKVEAVRLDYRRKRAAGDATVAAAVTQLQALEDDLFDAQRELDRYKQLSFSAFVRA